MQGRNIKMINSLRNNVNSRKQRLVYLLCLMLVTVSCKRTNLFNTKITAKTIVVDSIIKPSKNVNSVIAPYKEELETEMQQILTFTPKNLVKNDGNMQSSLGNLMADLCFDMANSIYKESTDEFIDFAMFNNGGIRSTIPAGNVTVERAFKLMPFENEFVVAEITGEKVVELIKYFIDNQEAHPFSKNVELIINDNNYVLRINGKDFNKNKTYKVLTSDYLQNGGDKMVFFLDPVKLTKLNYKIRSAIIDYFKKKDTLEASLDNRVIMR